MLRNLWLVLVLALLASPHPARAAPAIVIHSATVERHGEQLLLRLRFETPAKVSAFLLPAPQPRLVLDLPAALLLQDQSLTQQGSFATPHAKVRFARRTETASRLVLDLPAAGADLRVASTTAGGLIEVVASMRVPSAQSPLPAETILARLGQDAAPARTMKVVHKGRHPPLIVLDAGHGGRDPGASSTEGDQEKAITLAAALELQAMLEAKGFAVRLTREADSYVSLDERVELARDWGGELFLSLHADAAGDARTAGASVYTLSAKGGRRARRYRNAKAWVPEEGDPLISDIMFDLTQDNSVSRSAEFAEALLRSLDGAAPVLRNARRSAAFYVLQAPEVPAVLLEMGFLTNPGDARRLRSAEGRAPLLKAVARAIDEHFGARTLLAQSAAGAGAP